MIHPVRTFKTRQDLDDAFHAGNLKSDEVFHVESDQSSWMLDISGAGFVATEYPVDQSHYLIWWMNNWGLMATFSIMEEADGGNPNFSVLPGHLKLALRQAENTKRYHGQLIAPVTLRSVIDPELLQDIKDEPTLQDILTNGHFGIPFELAHFDTVKKYAGIITTPELKVPDLCALREQLKG